MKSLTLFILFSVLSLLTMFTLASYLFGYDEELNLREIIVSASRIEEPLEYTTGSCTVITEEEIRDSGILTVSDMLRSTPGVDVTQSGTMGEQTSVRLRGAGSHQTLVLIDGIKVNSPWNSYFDFADLLVDNVKRIEIIRGGQSALYGSEAMGGVINIITKGGKSTRRFTISNETGKKASNRARLEINGTFDDLRYSLSYSRIDLEGQFTRDDYHNNTFSSKLDYNLTSTSSLQLTTHFTDAEKELATDIIETPPYAAVIFDANNMLKKDSLLNTLSFRNDLFDWWNLSILGSITDTELDYSNPPDNGTPPPSNFHFEDLDTRSIGVQIQNNFSITESETLISGFEYRRDNIKDNSYSLIFGGPWQINARRENFSFYIQNNFNFNESFFFNTGFRVDKDTSFGSKATYKISSSYILDRLGLKLKGSLSTNFRAPSFQELYLPLYGNPNLAPEKSRSYEVGLEKSFFNGLFGIDATYFRIDFDDLMYIDATTFVIQNIRSALSQGIETPMWFEPHRKLKLSANHTYMDTKNKETGEEHLRIPRNKGTVKLDWQPINKLNRHMDIFITGKRKDYSLIDLYGILLTGKNAGYMKVNLSGSYEIARKSHHIDTFRIFTRIENLFDKEYQEVRGYPSPGMMFWVGLEAAF